MLVLHGGSLDLLLYGKPVAASCLLFLLLGRKTIERDNADQEDREQDLFGCIHDVGNYRAEINKNGLERDPVQELVHVLGIGA